MSGRLGVTGILCAVLVVVADVTIYGGSSGLGFAVLLAAIALMILALGLARGMRGGMLLTAAWALVVAASFAFQPGMNGIVLTALGLPALALIARGCTARSTPAWLVLWIGFIIRIVATLPLALDALRKTEKRRAKPGAKPSAIGALAARWIVPVVLAGGFLVLFSMANPVIEHIELRALERLGDFFGHINIARVIFWIAMALLVWPFLRPVRTREKILPPALPGQEPRPFITIAPGTAVRTLLLCNLVFVLQNALDFFYLWSGTNLPPGVTHTSYVHRGAYTLIATAILAGAFVLAAFQPGGVAVKDSRARKLVFAWIAQNLLLTASAAWRLCNYVEVYGLYRLRVASFIWMTLVFLGLAWICLRIATHRDNRWLLNANALTLLAILTANAWFNQDAFIARYNAERCKEMGRSSVHFDTDYAEKFLGPESLPALYWLRDNTPDAHHKTRLDQAIAKLEHIHDIRTRNHTWRDWTLTGSRLAAAIRERNTAAPESKAP